MINWSTDSLSYMLIDDSCVGKYISSIILNGGERGDIISKIIQIVENHSSFINDFYSSGKEIDSSNMINCVKLLAYQFGSIQGGIDSKIVIQKYRYKNWNQLVYFKPTGNIKILNVN